MNRVYTPTSRLSRTTTMIGSYAAATWQLLGRAKKFYGLALIVGLAVGATGFHSPAEARTADTIRDLTVSSTGAASPEANIEAARLVFGQYRSPGAVSSFNELVDVIEGGNIASAAEQDCFTAYLLVQVVSDAHRLQAIDDLTTAMRALGHLVPPGTAPSLAVADDLAVGVTTLARESVAPLQMLDLQVSCNLY